MADDSPQNNPGLHIDSDWKAEAQAEKQRLAQQAAASAAEAAASGGSATGSAQHQASGAAGREMPPADFSTMVSQMVTQAMFAMGMIADPQTGRRVAVLDMAKYHIDMLGVLEDKTQGNLSDEERKLLATALYELRMNYVQLSQQAVKQATGSDAASGMA